MFPSSSDARTRRTRRRHLAVLAAVALAAVSVGVSPLAPASAVDLGGAQAVESHGSHDNFSDPTDIDNVWSPLVPGTQLTFEGQVSASQTRTPHRVVFIVTDLTKVINGVRTVVIWDRDFDGKQLAESELAFEAQDDGGTVWNFGEYPEEYEQGVFVGAPSAWIDGVEGARAGILMKPDPHVDGSVYTEGWAPKIHFLDVATVSATGQRTCVPVACYDNVLVIDEWSPFDRGGGHQLKLYAPGVGSVRVEPVGGEEQESLVLVKISRLGRKDLAKVREAALKLDARAYEFAGAVFRDTPPAE